MKTYQARFEALGDRTRWTIVERLTRGPLSVRQLADGLPVSRPAVSQHLKVLGDAGLVMSVPDGTRRIYRLDPTGIESLRASLDQLWGDALAAFAAAVHEQEAEMTTEHDQAAATAVRRSITVDAPVEQAFKVFTDGFGTWWPMDFHAGNQDPQTELIEPRVDGRWYERAADGTESDWGVVLVWEAPTCLVLAWRLDAEWKHNPDPAKQTEIEVRFVPEGVGRTRVDLEHRLLDRYGSDAAEMRATFDSDAGWVGLLERYADAVASTSANEPLAPVIMSTLPPSTHA